ncbi:hypothetical protein [Actinomadura alba]|uniref:Uncharacterized protein n=1 Tax=Actinomadura alba TaxID=406431 RepID=A0ABR7LPJ5_9ACTN|nr:hypothetical protein [Actinomadura alba]MBC6466499.1 hypothetical protein [Actinomadura alba]
MTVLGDERRGTADLIKGAAVAAAEHGRSGRAVLFPGAARLTSTLTVREILDHSAIERSVEIRGYVRPEWQDGRLTLPTLPD